MVKSNSSSSLTLLFSFNSSFTALTYLSRSGSNRSVLEIFVQSQSSLVQSLSQETQKVDQGGFQSAFGMSLCSDPPGLGGSSASSGPRPWSRDTVWQTACFILLELCCLKCLFGKQPPHQQDVDPPSEHWIPMMNLINPHEADQVHLPELCHLFPHLRGESRLMHEQQ